MKNKVWAGVVILFVFIFVAGCAKENKENNQSQELNQEVSSVKNDQESLDQTINQENSSEEGDFLTSLKDLTKKGDDLKCSWQNSEEEGDAVQQGIMYISGEKFKQEVTVEGSKTLSMNMISDGEWLYQWSPSNKQGTKMKYSEIEKMGEEMNMPETEGSDNPAEGTPEAFNQQLDYKCEAWKADDSIFVAPKDIEFTDATKAFEELTKGAGNMMQGVCDSCNSLPERAKVECLKSCQQAQPE